MSNASVPDISLRAPITNVTNLFNAKS
jgi:hypothetical protein